MLHHTEVVQIRQPSTALLVIDSVDRNPTKTIASYTSGVNTTIPYPFSPTALPSTPYDFTISRNQNVFTGFVKRIGITEVVFSWGLFNINETCNTFYYTSGSQDGEGYAVPFQIPVRFYTADELATAITNAFSNIGDGQYSCVWNQDGSNRFSILNDGDNAFAIIPPANQAIPEGFINSPYKSLFDIMGFTYSTCGTFDITTKIAGNPPLMRWTEYIDIVCTNLTNNQHIKDFSTLPEIYNPKNLLCRLYLDDDLGIQGEEVAGVSAFKLYRQFQTPKMIEWASTQPIGNLGFQVFDDSGRILQSWAEGIQPTYACPDWKLTLLLSED